MSYFIHIAPHPRTFYDLLQYLNVQRSPEKALIFMGWNITGSWQIPDSFYVLVITTSSPKKKYSFHIFMSVFFRSWEMGRAFCLFPLRKHEKKSSSWSKKHQFLLLLLFKARAIRIGFEDEFSSPIECQRQSFLFRSFRQDNLWFLTNISPFLELVMPLKPPEIAAVNQLYWHNIAMGF